MPGAPKAGTGSLSAPCLWPAARSLRASRRRVHDAIVNTPRPESDPELWPYGLDDLEGGDYPIDPVGYDPDNLDRDETITLSDDAALIDYVEGVFIPEFEHGLELMEQYEWESANADADPDPDPESESLMRARQVQEDASPSGAEVVAAVWEQLQGVQLGARRPTFLARQETAALAAYPPRILTEAARMTMQDSPQGYLLLAAWLAAARRSSSRAN